MRRNNASDRIILPTNRFSSHASVSTLSRNPTRGVVVLGASHLEKLPGEQRRFDVAIRTLATAFVDENGDFSRAASEKQQEFVIAAAVSAPVEKEGSAAPEPGGADEMRAFVLSDADALSDLLMPRVPGNPLLAFDAVRWLVGEESLAGEIESEEDVRVEQTKQVNMAWFYSTVFGVPAIVLGCGVFISRRRKRAPQRRPATGPKRASVPAPPQDGGSQS